MAKRVEVFWVFVFLLINPVLSEVNEFVYQGFKGVDSNNLSLTGVAEIETNGVLQLTYSKPQLIGHAFYQTPIRFKNSTAGRAFSFSTAFAFAISSGHAKSGGGHGLAFAISPTKDFKGALSYQYLGLLNENNTGDFSNHLFAVEFDTVKDFGFKDISDNHAGIDINGLISNASVNASYFVQGNSTRKDLNLQSGKTIQAWIDYVSTKNELNVTLSLSSRKPSYSILSVPIDLSPILKDTMYVGFSASTGNLHTSNHYIQGWSFKINGEAQSLDLSSLPFPPGLKQNRTALIIGVSVSAVALFIAAVGTAFYLIRKIKSAEIVEVWELDIGPHRFSYKELKQATSGFGDKQLLGFGGFGKVYKGTLRNSNTQVAVKRISNESRQGLREFVSEIGSIGRLRHRNLVQLLGWCRRGGDLLLVYDFMPNGSLDKYIFDEPKTKTILSWEQRFKIIKGVASGLLYLHEGWEQTVIHRDIKSGNVLLDSELNGRLGDFGLAKLHEHGSNSTTTRVVGTLGYLAPELTRICKPTTSSDVFSFGALLLEVVCGRRPIEPKALPEELILMDWVWERWKEGAILEVVDPRLGGEYDDSQVVVVLKLGLMCSNYEPAKRPNMRQVVRYLEGEVGLPEILTPPYFETASVCSFVRDWKGNVDLEAGPASPLSMERDGT